MKILRQRLTVLKIYNYLSEQSARYRNNKKWDISRIWFGICCGFYLTDYSLMRGVLPVYATDCPYSFSSFFSCV